MRNMIFKTLFASILGSLFIAPLAHADRQGGGTLRAMNVAIDQSQFEMLSAQLPSGSFEASKEWVRFEKLDRGNLTFSYLYRDAVQVSLSEVTTDKLAMMREGSNLIRAVELSKSMTGWIAVD
ncbi:MAG: hypothetical protein JNJ49_13430 [Bdellovibrionaceae bacterium]|nr:hypothetical protein [Pseudobdellovibrionaceae bacterium]